MVKNRYDRHFRYKHLSFFLLTFFGAFLVLRNPQVHASLGGLGDFGFLGAFVGGMLYTASFTIAGATIILTIVSEQMHPVAVGLIGGVGAVIGDLLIFRFIRDSLGEEVNYFFTAHHGRPVLKFFKRPAIQHLLPIIGGLIIISPLPDELGIGLMGLSHLSTAQFMPISYVLNSIGIILLTTIMRG